MNFERIVEIHPAFDRRDPDPSKNYGIHGCEMRMVLKGEKGAIQFLLYTNWHLPHVAEELKGKPDSAIFFEPLPADIGYHSRTPHYEDHPGRANCPYLNGATCYYDGSSLNAQDVFEILLREGSEGVWKYMEDYYNRLFEPTNP